MKVTVERLDDINFVIRGTVANSFINEKVKELKEKFAKVQDDQEKKSDEQIEQEAAGEVFKAFIDAGIKEAKIDVESLLGQPSLKKYEQQGENVYFEVELSTSPEIDTNIDYSDVVTEFTKPVADKEAVEEKLAEFAQKNAPFQPLQSPKAVEDGDVVVIDFEGFIDEKPFEGGSAEKFKLKVGSKTFIPGFEEQLIGMEYGEKRTITVNFPKDYQAADLAGKESKFVVTLHEIHEQRAQTPDDEFAKKVLNDESATLDTLKSKLSDQIVSEELSQIYMEKLKPYIVEKLLSKFEFTLPNNIVEQEIDAKVREKTRGFSEEEHKTFINDKEKFKQLRESLREEAQKTIKLALIVEAIAKKEGIEVHDQEVQAAIGYQAMVSGQDPQELLKYYQENNLMHSAKLGLTEDKLFGTLLGFDK